ncbi:MAG: hypothetical protein PVG83_08640 [Acidimicrobiia bacterium]|jgi:hypothetical protein
MNIHRAETVSDDWGAVRSELERAFDLAREAARAEESFVFVVHHDDLLGRRGAGNAMVAAGLLSAARTAALEGSRKGWTANVIAFDEDAPTDEVDRWANWMLDSHGVTGEVIRVGPGHLGKALP